MNAMFLLAFRNLAYRKPRATLTVAGIAIGVAAAIGVFILDYNTLLTLKFREIGKYGTPEYEAIPLETGENRLFDSLERLRSAPSVRNATPLFFASLFIQRPDAPLGVEIIGVEPDASGWYGGYHLKQGGVDLSVTDGPVILLTDSLASRAGLSVGDTLRFTDPPDGAFRIVGLITSWKLGARNNGLVGLVPFRYGWEQFGNRVATPRFWMRTDGSLSLEQMRSRMSAWLHVLIPDYVLAGETGDRKVMRDGVRLSGLLALTLGLYLVFTSLSMALAERLREIGLMEALGTSDVQIMGIFLIEAAIMALIGAFLGLALGTALAWTLIQLGFSSLGVGTRIWGMWMPWGRVAGILGLGVMVAVSGALYPLLKSRRISVVEAIKPRGLRLEIVLSRAFYLKVLTGFLIAVPAGYAALGELLRLSWRPAFPLVLTATLLFSALLGLIFLGPGLTGAFVRLVLHPVKRLYPCEGLLVGKALTHATDRIAASLCTLALVFGGVIALKHMTLSLKDQARIWADQTLSDVVFVSSRLLSPEEYGAMSRIPGVRHAIPMSHTLESPFLIRGIPSDMLDPGPGHADSTLYHRFTGTPSLMLSTQMAQTLQTGEGDTLYLETRRGLQPFPVVMVTDRRGYFIDQRAYGVMALEQMTALFDIKPSAANRFTLILHEDADQNQVRNTLIERFGEYRPEIITGAEKYAWVVDGVDDDFFIFEIILWITGVLSGIGVTSALLIGALERRREFGLLQAIGATPGQMGVLVLLEGAVIGVVGGLLGAGAGAPLSWMVIEGLRMISDLPLVFVFSPAWAGYGVLGAVAVSTLAGVYPAWKTIQTSVTESIQYE